MNVVIPKETVDFEKRVAATPETVKKMVAAGLTVTVQSGAGQSSFISDQAFIDAGAVIEASAETLYKNADIILKVQKPEQNDINCMKAGACLIGLLQPMVDHELVQSLAAQKVTSLSMDAVPRIARAQRLDALSSQSNIAGYKAVLMGANALTKLMPMMMTAAGTIPAAKVLVIGAGVAGLQAVATAKRLGAIVEAFDTRPVVKEQVESLGGKFIELEMNTDTEDAGGYAKELSKEDQERQKVLMQEHAKAADIVITTALIPGKKAPILVTEEMVKAMRPGSVVVDLAVDGGGNCELSKAGEEVVVHDVTVIGYRNIPSTMAAQSSALYARNISGLLLDHIKEGKLELDKEDEIVQGSLITEDGAVVNSRIAEILNKGANS